MSNISDVGNLIHVYIDYIIAVDIEVTPHIIESAKTLNNNGGRNWIPIIVKETGIDQYQIIGDTFVYAVCKAANLDKVWCIVVDDSTETENTVMEGMSDKERLYYLKNYINDGNPATNQLRF